MALLNGRTPEEMASEIIADAVENQVIEIDGVRFQELEKLARYDNRDSLKADFEKNKDRLMKDSVEKLIADKFKAIEKYQTKREQDKRMQYFLLLRAKGMNLEEAERISKINEIV